MSAQREAPIQVRRAAMLIDEAHQLSKRRQDPRTLRDISERLTIAQQMLEALLAELEALH